MVYYSWSHSYIVEKKTCVPLRNKHLLHCHVMCNCYKVCKKKNMTKCSNAWQIFKKKHNLNVQMHCKVSKKVGMFVQSLLTIIFKKANLLKLIFNFEELLHSPNNKSIVYTYMIWLVFQNRHQLIQVLHTQLTSPQISQHVDIVKKNSVSIWKPKILENW